mmetsp:Transcript_6477/g.7191  ORF Transcript_6477/g.7191 Transcript_6477/m.7191 type:complete len:126 (-) Transcript_6477:181-558(-)
MGSMAFVSQCSSVGHTHRDKMLCRVSLVLRRQHRSQCFAITTAIFLLLQSNRMPAEGEWSSYLSHERMNEPHPSDDGVYLLDFRLEGGKSCLDGVGSCVRCRGTTPFIHQYPVPVPWTHLLEGSE